MAINPVNFIVSPSATATNGSDTITVTGSVDCSRVFAGTAVFIGTRHVVEALSGTVPDVSGNSTIKLKENWTDPTTTAVLTAIYTPEGLATAINYARDIVANISSIDGLVGTGLIEKTGVGTYNLLQKATTVQAQAGVDDTAYSTSKKVADYVNKYGVGNTVPQTLTDINLAGQVGAGFFCTLGGTANMPLGILNSTVLSMYRNETGSTSELDGSQFIIGKDGLNNTRIGARFAYDVESSTVPFLELYHTGNLAKATTVQAQVGSDDTAYSTSKKVADYVSKLGFGSGVPDTIADFNQMGQLNAGVYRALGGSANTPFGSQGCLFHVKRDEAGQAAEIDGAQLFISDGGIGYRFAFDAIPSTVPFLKIWSDYDIANAQNLSGATVSSNATTAGSNLNPAQSGTWRNVSGNDILNNGYGLFKRV